MKLRLTILLALCLAGCTRLHIQYAVWRSLQGHRHTPTAAELAQEKKELAAFAETNRLRAVEFEKWRTN